MINVKTASANGTGASAASANTDNLKLKLPTPMAGNKASRNGIFGAGLISLIAACGGVGAAQITTQ